MAELGAKRQRTWIRSRSASSALWRASHAPLAVCEADLGLAREGQSDLLHVGRFCEVKDHAAAQAGRVGVAPGASQDNVFRVQRDLDPARSVDRTNVVIGRVGAVARRRRDARRRWEVARRGRRVVRVRVLEGSGRDRDEGRVERGRCAMVRRVAVRRRRRGMRATDARAARGPVKSGEMGARGVAREPACARHDGGRKGRPM